MIFHITPTNCSKTGSRMHKLFALTTVVYPLVTNSLDINNVTKFGHGYFPSTAKVKISFTDH